MNQEGRRRNDRGGERARFSRKDRLVAALTAVVLVSGAITYAVDTLTMWIGWWAGTTAIVGWVLVRLNR